MCYGGVPEARYFKNPREKERRRLKADCHKEQVRNDDGNIIYENLADNDLDLAYSLVG